MSAFRFQGSINSALGPALTGVDIYVCTQPANTSAIPPSPLATLFADSGGVNPLANPVQTDGLGNYFFYAATGTYTIVVFDPLGRINTQVFPDQQVVSPGGGSVQSIALTMPAEFSVAGSPITSSGTIAVSKANENANTIFAGPASGPAAAPTFRSLVSADFPAGVGTVSSVGVGISGSGLLSLASSGGPITSSGTINLTVNFVNQNPNTFLAGPASGGSPGAVTARAIVPLDLPGQIIVADAASITFDASVNGSFVVTLSQNTVLTAINNGVAGQRITTIIKQNVTGGWTLSFPATVKGWSNIAPDANSVSVQDFIFDGSSWRATGPGQVNSS